MKKFCLIAMLLAPVPALTQGLPDPVTILPGDLNGDSVVGTNDLMLLLSLWGIDYEEMLPCLNAQAVDFEGYEYDVVEIGSQCWFAENLRTAHYANGDPIPGNLDVEWTSTSSGAQTAYGEGVSEVYDGGGESVANLETYGRLYNWYAVDDSRGLCPSGWHVPTDGEWMTLEMELGMSSLEANSTGWRGTDQGAQMKSSTSDFPSWDGTNTSGFSALPGGQRYDFSEFFGGEGNVGYWWSSSPNGSSNAWYRRLGTGVVYSDFDYVTRNDVNLRAGFSVRCLRDE